MHVRRLSKRYQQLQTSALVTQTILLTARNHQAWNKFAGRSRPSLCKPHDEGDDARLKLCTDISGCQMNRLGYLALAEARLAPGQIMVALDYPGL